MCGARFKAGTEQINLCYLPQVQADRKLIGVSAEDRHYGLGALPPPAPHLCVELTRHIRKTKQT